MRPPRSTVSLWMDTVSPPEFPALTQDTEAEVCVIGAGIAGLTTAYLLAKKGVAVTVLDDRHIGGGETERTTAHLSNELDDRYTEIVRIHGEEKAVLIARSHTDAIGMIATIVREEKIDCDFRRVDGYLFPGEGQEESMLDEELEAAHRAGLLDVHKLDAVPLQAAIGPALCFPDQAQFHPTRYLEGLARAVEKHGGKIYTRTHVSKIEEDEQPVKIHTDNNALVFAQNVIVATNAPINDNVHIYTKQAPYRTFVVGLRIPKDSVQPGLYWDMLDPYHYVRTQSLDGTHDVLIVGGEDHRSGTEDDMPARLDRLEAWTKKRLGISGKRLYGWSGQVMETMDGLAMIGQLPGAKEWSFIATGDSGMGMTHGTIAGMMLSSLATDKTHPWAEIYDPARFRLKAATEFLKENMGTGAALVGDWVKPGEVSDPEKIAPGSGAVIRKGVSKIALYRDDAGAFHACSAVCPHKGCVVQWNDGEKSWDCPCHGSRYDATGKVVNGPSLKDLEPAEGWNN